MKVGLLWQTHFMMEKQFYIKTTQVSWMMLFSIYSALTTRRIIVNITGGNDKGTFLCQPRHLLCKEDGQIRGTGYVNV